MLVSFSNLLPMWGLKVVESISAWISTNFWTSSANQEAFNGVKPSHVYNVLKCWQNIFITVLGLLYDVFKSW